MAEPVGRGLVILQKAPEKGKMATFEFDGDEDDTEEYYLVAEEGSVDDDSYGMFIDSFHGHRAYHRRYTQA